MRVLEFKQGNVGKKFQLFEPSGQAPIPNRPFKITYNDGSVVEGMTDAQGYTPLGENVSYRIAKIELPEDKKG